MSNTLSTAALSGEAGQAVSLGGFLSQDHFQAFYDRTAKPLYGYLCRVLQDGSRADDLLQEAYLRLMRATLPDEADFAHRKNYLFRVATNLLHDHFRASRQEGEMPAELREPSSFAAEADLRGDLRQALETLSARDRQLLWLAYVERYSHREIAEWTGLKEQSIRPMLLRARHRLAEELRQKGLAR